LQPFVSSGRRLGLLKLRYLSVTLHDLSFPSAVYVRLIEGEHGMHDLIWAPSKPQAV
jgi:uncharacterized protein (DUF736 family)